MNTKQTSNVSVLDKQRPVKAAPSHRRILQNVVSDIYLQQAFPEIRNQLWNPPPIVASSGGGGQVPKPKPKGSKPLPDPPRSKDNVENMVIYALLVGINDYETPVGKLHGCINDVDAVAQYLRDVYGDGNPVMEANANSDSNSNGNGGGFFGPVMDFFTGGNNASSLPDTELNGKVRILMLKDQQATRENIIWAFENHLSKATGRDSVWFHFSGHGAQQFTADEFFEFRKKRDANGQILNDVPDDPPINPSGKDQCLVCYTPSDTDDNREQNHKNRYLTDKELAKLIKKIEATGRSSEGQKPHIVMSIDACNSGSISRHPDFIPRLHQDPDLLLSRDEAVLIPGKVKNLADYYGDYTRDNLLIPDSLHVALSGSQSNQLSWDGSNGGIFTTSLIRILRDSLNREISLNYNELFLRTRSHAQKMQAERGIENPQNPQFQTLGGFNPYVAFLEGWQTGAPGRYPLTHQSRNDQSRWLINCGAVHGIPSIPRDEEDFPKVQVRIFEVGGNQDEFYPAFIHKVAAQKSLLSFDWGADENGVPFDVDQELSPDKSYEGEVVSLPGSPFYIHVEGPHKGELLGSAERDRLEALNIFLTDTPESEGQEAPLAHILVDEDKKIQVHNLRADQHITTLDPGLAFEEIRDKILQEGMEKLATAERFIELENPHSRIGDMFDIKLIQVDNQQEQILSLEDISEGQGSYRRIVIHANEEEHGQRDEFGELDHFLLSCTLRVEMDRVPQTLHFYSFRITPAATIAFYSTEEENVFWEKGNEDRKIAKNLREGEFVNVSLSTNQEDFHDTFWFKVIATTEELDFQSLIQTGLVDGRDTTVGPRNQISNDWATVTFEIHFTKAPPEEPENA